MLSSVQSRRVLAGEKRKPSGSRTACSAMSLAALRYFVEQRGRDVRERLGGVGEPLAAGPVGGELARRPQVHAGQVADRVVVLGVAQAAERDVARIAGARPAPRRRGSRESRRSAACARRRSAAACSLGGISPASSISMVCCHGFSSLRTWASVAKRSRSRLPFLAFVEWHDEAILLDERPDDRVELARVGVALGFLGRRRPGVVDERGGQEGAGDQARSQRTGFGSTWGSCPHSWGDFLGQMDRWTRPRLRERTLLPHGVLTPTESAGAFPGVGTCRPVRLRRRLVEDVAQALAMVHDLVDTRRVESGVLARGEALPPRMRPRLLARRNPNRAGSRRSASGRTTPPRRGGRTSVRPTRGIVRVEIPRTPRPPVRSQRGKHW